jgi:hypothetical protein
MPAATASEPLSQKNVRVRRGPVSPAMRCASRMAGTLVPSPSSYVIRWDNWALIASTTGWSASTESRAGPPGGSSVTAV